jgi:holo-[acyl-carrier protein] synthase
MKIIEIDVSGEIGKVFSFVQFCSVVQSSARIIRSMPILGHGIDLVEVARICRIFQEHGQHFLDRVYTPAEQQYCSANPKRYFEHLAGRFAAKEAVLKALGTGWSGGIAWTDVEVTRDSHGRPGIRLSGQCARIAAERRITHWLISLSHIGTHATASAIGIAQSPETRS